jgi:signal transduction histidine kinase
MAAVRSVAGRRLSSLPAGAWNRIPHLWIKFLLILVPMVAVAAAALATGLLVLKERALVAQAAEDVGGLATAQAPALAEAVWTVDRESVYRLLAVVLANRHVVCVVANDTVSGKTEALPRQDCLDGVPRTRLVERPLVRDGRDIGSLVAAVTTVHIQDELRRAAMADFLVAGTTLAAMVAGVFFGYRSTVSAPLQRLEASLRRTGPDGVRTPVDWQAADELGRVIAAYNEMIGQVESRTEALSAAKEQAEAAYADLKRAQESLVLSEKLASLGSLVAGVAHEVNTPIGNCLTTATHLETTVGAFAEKLAGGRLTRGEAQHFVQAAEDSTAIIVKNIGRAAELILGFKQVAADQTSSERRPFELGASLNEIMVSLQPAFRRTPHRVSVTCLEAIAMDSFPGALAQVVSNLVMNSLIHGLDDDRPGTVAIDATAGGDHTVVIRYADDGRGIAPEHLARVFDPFFTTRRHAGGTGLGLHIVHNIVFKTLGGEIAIENQPGRGVAFVLRLPRVAPVRA